jgi:ribosomal protein L21E
MIGRLVKFVDRDGRYPEFDGAVGLVICENKRNLAVKWIHPIGTKQVLVKGSHFHANRFEIIS